MAQDRKALRYVSQVANAAVASSLCMLLVVSPLVAEAPATRADVPATAHGVPLTQQEKVLHTLNRLTFGPRPGDEAAVRKMGLEAWFQQQLHPEQIDDSAFAAREDAYPAMKLPLPELLTRFPTPQTIRQLSQRNAPLPSDPVLHAVYADAIASYAAQKKEKEAASQPPAEAQAQPNRVQGTGDGMTQAASPVPMDASGDDMMMAATRTQPKKGKGLKSLSEEAMSPDQVQEILSLPGDQKMQHLLDMSSKEMVSLRLSMKPAQRAALLRGLTPEQQEIVEAMQSPVRVVGAEAMESRLDRDVYSERQLQAVMTDFWLNHFSVYARKNQNEPYYLPSYERETILPNALGKFENLLVATAKSPAMMMYLDNWQSTGPDSEVAQRALQAKQRPNGQGKQPVGVNENYARELMELHTLGVNGGYTQKDVQEVAKVFTGWTIDRPYQGAAGTGEVIFDGRRHEGGSKVVLGQTIPEGGSQEGMAVLHMLATSPATAQFISTKLAVRFVSDNPPPSLVNKMAQTFLKTDGDIKAVLSAMFHAPEFWSPAVYRAKVKTPIEFVSSALRASNANVLNPLPLVQAMGRLGMPIYGMQTPNGYSWKQDDWVSSNALISRMNFALVLSGDRLPGTTMSWTNLLSKDADIMAPTPATEKELETVLLGQPASQKTRATVLDQFKNPQAQLSAEQSFNTKPVSDDSQEMGGSGLRTKAGREFPQVGRQETPLDTMAGLLLGSPDFQRR